MANMSRYFIDKEHKSCLDTDEDWKSHLDTLQDQWSMSDGPVLKQTIRYVDNDLLTREHLLVRRRKNSHYLVLKYSQ